MPVLRLPEGKQCDVQKPSCLDFAFVPKNMASKPWLSWHMRPADHAFLHLVVPGVKPIIQYKPSTLRLLSWGQCLAWVERKSTSEHLEIESFMNFVRLFMNENADQRNRRQRRKERIPAHVQRLFEASEQALSEDARRHHRAQALLFLRRHYQVLRAEGARCLHGSGRLLRGSSNLHRIEKVILSSEASGSGKAGVVSTDREDWKCEMVHEFSIRWASGNLQKRALIYDFLDSSEGVEANIDIEDIWSAVDTIKPSNRIDSDGITADALRVLGFGCPEVVLHHVRAVLASRKVMERFVVDGSLKGKTSSLTAKQDVRSILPLPAFLNLCDCVLSRKLEIFISELLPKVPYYYAGASKGTQPSDIVFPVSLAIEKGLDNQDEGAIAVADVKSYYDSLSPFLICTWLISRGAPVAVAAAFLRLHVVPAVRIKFDIVQFQLRERTRGLLTGTRSANIASRIPIGDACLALAPKLLLLGYKTPHATLAVSSWVDNLTAIARDVEGACQILELIREFLRQHWKLEYKASSLECLSVKPIGVEIYKDYTVKANLDLLGHFISANGRWDYAWAEVRKRVFRALFAKFRSCHTSLLSLNGVAAEVQRHVWPVIRYRSNCWPFRIDVQKRWTPCNPLAFP